MLLFAGAGPRLGLVLHKDQGCQSSESLSASAAYSCGQTSPRLTGTRRPAERPPVGPATLHPGSSDWDQTIRIPLMPTAAAWNRRCQQDSISNTTTTTTYCQTEKTRFYLQKRPEDQSTTRRSPPKYNRQSKIQQDTAGYEIQLIQHNSTDTTTRYSSSSKSTIIETKRENNTLIG